MTKDYYDSPDIVSDDMYKCPACGQNSLKSIWERASEIYYGSEGDYQSIEDSLEMCNYECYFLCPACRGEFKLGEILDKSGIDYWH